MKETTTTHTTIMVITIMLSLSMDIMVVTMVAWKAAMVEAVMAVEEAKIVDLE